MSATPDSPKDRPKAILVREPSEEWKDRAIDLTTALLRIKLRKLRAAEANKTTDES